MERLPEGSPVFNVCTGRTTSVLELAETVAELCGSEPTIQFQPPRAGEIKESLGNPERAAAVLGVRARVDLRSGLTRTLELRA